jgi:hypothetical protein
MFKAKDSRSIHVSPFVISNSKRKINENLYDPFGMEKKHMYIIYACNEGTLFISYGKNQVSVS